MTFSVFLKVVWSRKWLILFVMATASILVGTKSLLTPKQYKATSSIIINVNGKDPITGAIIPTLMQPSFLATQVEIIKSINVASKVVTKLQLSNNIDLQKKFGELQTNNGSFDIWLGYALLNNLQVTPSRQSSIIYITYTSGSPTQAAQIANAFAEAFIQTNLDLKSDPSRRTALWYETQVENIRDEMVVARESLSNYQQETGIISITEGYGLDNSRLTQLNNQLVQLNSTLNALETKQITFNNFDPSTPNASTISDTMIDRLKVAYVTSQLNFAEVSGKFSENHPNYLQSSNDMSSKRERLIKEIQSSKSKLVAEISETKTLISNIEAAIQEQTQVILSNNKKRDILKVLVNKVQNTESLFNATTQRFNQFKLAGDSLDTDVSILNRANSPFSHSNSSVSTNVIITLLFSGLVSLFLVLMLEQLNKKIRDKKTIEDSFDIPVLAETPKIKL
ncbi:MAG: Wzz/FepE/Etk N-terminal domain-containing protein [Paraglaciecola sp.]|uniref:Wzz/FepE/Etk N-terminal domain-containing protein n=1 Tax=Paraglaciecola sp. TaxID=1920173 RepID=UPI003298D45B